ncbi:S-layer homology domain-containing protein [Paenibacillus sp. DYY-L-2]|uniref:S-layer homology domain-containing protein n=1 Tax=Paenibacillus sp. DYY-L-2 TaxID=3447013 RepID=UPI003F507858
MKRKIAHKACVSLLSLLLVANSLPFMNSQVKAAAGSGDGISTDARYVTFPGSGLAQVGGAINISDTIDGKTTIDGATAVINGFVAGDALTFPADTDIDGIDITNKGNGVYVLTGTADISTYENLLNSAQFSAGNTTSPHIRNISFSLGSALAFSENGHFYEFVNTGTSITWHAAQKAAEARTYFGRQGYLVTITSASENDFVKSKAQGLGWIGGKDIARPEKTSNGVTTAVGAHQKGTGDWRWVTGPEGLEDGGKGLQFYSGYYGDGGRSVYNATYGNPTTKVMYTLMDKGTEPNDTGGSEYVLHIFATGYWNDYSPTNKVTAYVVEYGGIPNDVVNVDISTTVTVIDKSVLQKKYDDITKEGLIESSYTPDSWNALNIALSEAEAVLNSASATVDEIGQAYETLAKARDGLMKNRPVPIKTSDIFYEGEQTLTIEFDKGVQIGSGTAPDAFTVTVGGKTLPVASAKVDSANPAKVTLTLEVPLSANIGEQVHVVYHGDTGYLLGKESGGTAVGDFDFDVNEDPFSQNLKITAPAENTDDRQPEINGAAPDSPDSATITVAGPDDVANKVIDGEALVINPDGSWSFDNYAADLAPGTYTVTLAATKGGRTATKTYTFTIVDKTELQSEADKATGLTETDYTSVSWNNYKDALEAAQIVLDNHNASQDEVNSATTALQAAYDALTLQPPVAESGSFTEGGNTIMIVLDKGVKIGAGTAQDAFTVTIGGVKVPVDGAMVDSADPAKVILTLPAGTQLPSNQTIHVEYEGASGYLLGAEPNGSAVPDFNFDVVDPFAAALKITEPSGNTSDKTPAVSGSVDANADSLTVAVTDENGNTVAVPGELSWNAGDTTWSYGLKEELPPGTYTIVVTAVTGGRSVQEKRTFTITEIVDKTALQTEISLAGGLDEAIYTPESWSFYQEKLAEAQIVMDKADATQAEVKTALKTLTAAREGLVTDSGHPVVNGLALDKTNPGRLVLTFDQPVKVTSDELNGFNISGQRGPITVTQDVYELSEDGLQLILHLDRQIEPGEQISLTYAENLGNIIAVESGKTLLSFNRTVTRPANTGGGTTGGSGSNGSGNSSNVPPGPTTQTIVVDVVIGGDEEAGITKVPIERTTYADGRVVDKVIYTKDKAQETVDKALQAGKNVARILIPDASDKVSEVNLQIPADTVALLQNSGIDFEIYNPNAFIQIPSASLKGLTESFYFRLVPVKNKSEREEIEARARTEEVVRKWSKDDNIEVVARPMTIETNLSSRPVTLTLPLRDVKLPEDANERAKFLKRLGIFIEHTNGGKEVVKGTAVTMPDGQLGLQFSIDHFSTFTIIDFNREISDGQHTPYVQGFPDGEFKPLENVTRGQLAAMIARNLGYVEGSWSGEAPFSDVSKTSWSAGVIAFVKERGIMHGMPDGSFRPNDAVTRAEIATVIVNYRKLAVTEGGEIGFNDIAGHWAQWNIQAVRNSGLIAGFQDGGFKPDNYASRAEAVVMVNRMFERGPLHGVATPSFEDVPAAHWAFRDIEEAATTHSYLIDGEQKEVVTE